MAEAYLIRRGENATPKIAVGKVFPSKPNVLSVEGINFKPAQIMLVIIPTNASTQRSTVGYLDLKDTGEYTIKYSSTSAGSYGDVIESGADFSKYGEITITEDSFVLNISTSAPMMLRTTLEYQWIAFKEYQ